MIILKLLFFKHVSVKSQGSSGGVVFLILILLMKILAVITKLIRKGRCQFLKEGREGYKSHRQFIFIDEA